MTTSPKAFLRRVLVHAVIGGLCTVVVSITPLASQAANDEFLVNDDSFGEENRIDPVVVRLDGDDFLVLWADNGRGHTDIMARVLTRSLEPTAEPFRVNTEEGHFQHRQLDISPAGGGVIASVWQDDRLGTGQIFVRLFQSSDGSPLNPEARVSLELGFGSAQTPAVSTASSGRSLVVWTANTNQHKHVFGQILAPDGTREGENIDLVPTGLGRTQAQPAVTTLPDGRWLLVWSEEDDSRDENIFYRFLASDGSPTGTVRRANTDLFSDVRQSSPHVTFDGNKELIVWSDGRNSSFDIWGRWIDSAGEPLGPETLMREAPDAPGDLHPRLVRSRDGAIALQWFGGIDNRQRMMGRFLGSDGGGGSDSFALDDPPAGVLMRNGMLAPADNGNWVAVWSDNRSFVYNCYAREVDLNGAGGSVSTVFSVPRSSSQVYGDVAVFPDNRAIAVWSDLQFGSLTIFGRFLDETGEPVGSSFQVSGVPANAQFDTIDSIESLSEYSPSVAASADGFVVTWAINQDGGLLNLFAQFYTPDGQPIGGNFRVAPDAIRNAQWAPRPAMMPGGGFVIAYQMNTANAGGDVFLQRYAGNGAPIGGRIQIADSPPAAQIDPVVAVSEFGQIMVGWVDHRGGGWDVYAQLFTANGDKIGVNEIQHGADAPFSDQVRPSVGISADRTITVWEERPNLEGLLQARLEIFPSFTADGTPLGDDKNVRLFTVNNGRVATGPKYPSVAMAGDGRFVITWWDNASGQTELLAQPYDADGNPIGDAYPIHGTGAQGSRLDPQVAVTSDFVQFLWSDSRRSKGWDIRSRRVGWDFAGAPSPVRLARWEATEGPAGVSLEWGTASEIDFSGFHVWRQSEESESVSNPRPGATAARLTLDPISPDKDGQYGFADGSAPVGFVAYWLEAIDRSGTSEYFGPLTVRVHAARSASAWPNPFQQETRLRLPDVPGGSLEILDVAGRVVRSLPGREGEFWMWNGRDNEGLLVPAGVYFVRTPKGPTNLKLLRIR